MIIYTRFSTYRWKLNFLVLHLKLFVYTLTLYFIWEELKSKDHETIEFMPNSTYEKTPCQVKVCKKLISAPIRG